MQGFQRIPVSAFVDLTVDQQEFLARACAFIATSPAQDELNKLLTLGKMLLPAPVAEMLEKRAVAAAGSPSPDDPPSPRTQ